MKIDIVTLGKEDKELTKAMNAWFHHYSVHPEIADKIVQNHVEDLKSDCQRMALIPDEIEYLQRPSTAHNGAGYGDTTMIREHMPKDKLSSKTMGRIASDYLSHLARRRAAIRILIDDYSSIDEGSIKDSQATRDAASKFRSYVQTSIGWSNAVLFEVGTPGTCLSYNEEVRSTYASQTRVNWKYTVGVDRSYIDVVQANGITVVDVAGKPYLTVAAEEIEEHELKDQGIQLFQAKILSTKVGRDQSSWACSPGDGKKIVLLEDRVIAVQHYESNRRPSITTGKDQSWAIRTMKQRMKKEMMQMMDII